MDAIDALDSSTPKPRKKRENIPLTKPPAKTNVKPLQSDRTSNEKGTVLGGDVTQTAAKNGKVKKNRSRKTAALNSDTMNSNTDTTEVTPSPSISSPLQEPPQDENVNLAAHSEAKIDQKSEKKKKKKKMNEDTLGENLNETLEHRIDSKEEINKESVAPNNTICNDHGNKNHAKGNDDDDSKELIGNVEITESIVQQKKLKKKKKNKSGDFLEQKTEGEINSEKTAEEDTVLSKKAKKKKEKIDVDGPEKIIRAEEMQTGEPEIEEKAGEENSEQISNEKKRKKKRKHREVDSEVVVESRKMFEEQKDEENVTNPSACTDEENHTWTPELNHKNKKGSLMKNGSKVLTPLPPGQETLGLPSEKRVEGQKKRSE